MDRGPPERHTGGGQEGPGKTPPPPLAIISALGLLIALGLNQPSFPKSSACE